MIDRRDFLKIAGAVIPSWGLIPIAQCPDVAVHGQDPDQHPRQRRYRRQLVVRPARNRRDDEQLRRGTHAGGVAGNIRAAPMGNNAAFLQRYFRNMLVINGVNSETNSHDDGTRAHATGMLAMGYPNLSELFAPAARQAACRWPGSMPAAMNTSVGLAPATPMPDANTFRTLAFAERRSTPPRLHQGRRCAEGPGGADRAAEGAAGRGQPDPAGAARQCSSSKARRTRARCWLACRQFLPATFDYTPRTSAWSRRRPGSPRRCSSPAAASTATASSRTADAQSLPRLTNLVDYIMHKSG